MKGRQLKCGVGIDHSAKKQTRPFEYVGIDVEDLDTSYQSQAGRLHNSIIITSHAERCFVNLQYKIC